MVQCHATISINVGVQRVWRALFDPGEVPVWDTNVTGAIDVPASYPHLPEGQPARWRYMIGPVPCVLYDQPVEAVDRQKYVARIRVAFLEFDETITVTAEADTQTRVTYDVDIRTRPRLPRLFDRLLLRPITNSTLTTSLQKLREWCETPGQALNFCKAN